MTPTRSNSKKESPGFSRVGVFQALHLKEENIRFVLLAILLCLYLSLGALLFKTIEESTEQQSRSEFEQIYNNFVNGLVNDSSYAACLENPKERLENVHQLLYAYGNATKAGVIFKRKRWDFLGSFHFAWTIVSTIGYGATTPTTSLGKILVFPFGFIGCSMGLLFFNLFLERIITFLTYLASSIRVYRQKRRSLVYARSSIRGGGEGGEGPTASTHNSWGATTPAEGVIGHVGQLGRSTHSSTEEISDGQADWKPSVYWVFLCLFFMSTLIIFASAALFSIMESWSFLDSSYSSFVSYATIGFGDFVSLQHESYGDFEGLYRPVAFLAMIFGCCCIYSLLNVTSIIIKQFLNFLIKKIDCRRGILERCCCCCNSSCFRFQRHSTISVIGLGRKRSRRRQQKKLNGFGKASVLRMRSSQTNLEMPDLDERRYSGENMISIGGDLSNKVSLAVMQKRLYESAQMNRDSTIASGQSAHDFSASTVGPLAILREKLGPE